MQLSKDQQEKITLMIQGVLGAAIIVLSVKNAAAVENAHQKKLARKNAKEISRLQRKEYKLKHRLMKEKYKTKMKKEKAKRAS